MIAGSSCIPAEVLCISGLLQGPEQPNLSEDLWRGHLQWHNKWLQCGECELKAINSRIFVICELICELCFVIWSWQSLSYLEKEQSVGQYLFWCTRFVSSSFVVVVEQVLAKKFGAAIVTLEHRYYGESSPFEDLTSENLKYLSSNQALFDLAAFRKFFQVLLLFLMCCLLNILSLNVNLCILKCGC
jgi:NADH:ubiquinone oxidoreductase subunit 5 (subunit L)/multisubunit Na+/H+ antiporter MnhA subunit